MTYASAFTCRFDPPLTGNAGIFSGKTFAVKDNFDVAGSISAAGCPEWGAAQGRAKAHAPMVSALLAQGAALIGKTQMDSLAYGLMGENAKLGTPPNPAALGYVPGGSSSGAASAVAAGLADIGLGTDTAGSIRLPASFCNLYGWRPSHGILPLDGVVALAPSFDVAGFVTRDFGLMAALIAHFAAAVPACPHRFFFPQDLWDVLPQPIGAHLRAGLPLHHCDTTPMFDSPDGIEACFTSFRTCQSYEISQQFAPWIAQAKPDFAPDLQVRFDVAAKVSADCATAADHNLKRMRAALAQRLSNGGVAVFPTVSGPAPLCNSPNADVEAFRNASLRLLSMASATGLAQITIPFSRWQGRPIGLSFAMAQGEDAQLPAAISGFFAAQAPRAH